VFEAVEAPRVARDGEVSVLLRQPTSEAAPRAAAILAPPHSGGATRTSAGRRIQRHHVHGVGIVGVDENGKSEVRRQSLRYGSPGMPIVVAAKHPDVRPRSPWPGPFSPSAVVLHIKPAGSAVVP